MVETIGLDTGETYAVASYPGIAFHFDGYDTFQDEDYEWTGIECENRDMARMIMVGDDHVFLIDTDELSVIDDRVCSCGQIDCGW